MATNAQNQGRVPRRAAGHPSSVRTVVGTSTHVDASDKMTTGPSTDMAFLDNYIYSLSSDLNTPEVDLKAFDFGKENAKSKLTITGMEVSKMTTSPQSYPENTAFFDMSISSPPAFIDEDPASSTQNYRVADQCNSQYYNNSMMPTEHVEEPIPKAPLLTNSQPLRFNSISHRNNPVMQPSAIPFDIPDDIFNNTYLFADADLGLNDDELINDLNLGKNLNLDNSLNFDDNLNLDMYLGHQGPKNDILSQAIVGAELPSSEQLNNLLEMPGMIPPTIAQQQPAQLTSVKTSPAQIAPALLSRDSTQSKSAPQEIVIPNLFRNTSEYQTITYQVQGFAPSSFLQVQTNTSDSAQLMEVDNTPSNTIDNSSDSANFSFLPSLCTSSAPTIELPEESESKPVNIFEAVPSTSTDKQIFGEAVPSTSTGKRRRTVQKPARYRESLVEYPFDESQPSTSVIGEKKFKLSDEQKYNRIRIMNNEASRKCRQKRKQSMVNVEHEIVELENKQKSLKAKEAELTKMRDKMKAIYFEFMKKKMAPR